MSNKILDNMRDVMRRRHYSIRTERNCCGLVKRFHGLHSINLTHSHPCNPCPKMEIPILSS
jgi:hypothetical protein